MENASKALLIAGAVLIAIVLISIGMLIVQYASGITDTAGDSASKQGVTAFNREYEQSQGDQRGSSVRNILGSVSANNASNASGHIIAITMNDSKKGISVSKETNPTKITQLEADIVNSATYKIIIEDKDSDGYITEIKITR